MILEVARSWSGELLESTVARVELRKDPAGISVEIDASFAHDPAPTSPPGRCWKLWEHEVVELFLLGDQERYLELELGPHQHWLALELKGPRQIVDESLELEVSFWRDDLRWGAGLHIPQALLPPGVRRVNAYAISGRGSTRRHNAWAPVPGPAPDFHRLECFGLLEL